MCVHEAGSIKMSAIGEWQCADDWWLTNAKSRLRFCSMMSNIDSVSVGSYANARALQWGLRLKLPAKKTPNNNNKKILPLSWQEIFLENFEGNCSRKGVNSEHVPKGRRACRTLLQLWWELGAKSFSAATFFGAVLHLCSSCSSPRQQPTSATFHRFIFLTEAAGPCYTTPALLHSPLPTVHTQAKLLWVCKLLLRAKVVANPDKPASAGKWWDHGAWNPTLLFVPGSVTFSLTETHLPRMALGMDSDYLSASGSEKYPQREVKLYWQAL